MSAYVSKTDLVAARLRELIVVGDLAPGAPLRQRDLAARFGVSPTPVREALRRLESEGLVVGDAHRGATVARAEQGSVRENYRIRAALEPLAAELAAERIGEEQLAELALLNERLRLMPDGDPDYLRVNAQFHLAIYQAGGSPVLVSLIRTLWQAMAHAPRPTRAHAASADQHAALLVALARRDGAEAAAIMREHILAAVPDEVAVPDGQIA